MSGLMMVFLFIAVVFMENTEKSKNDLVKVAEEAKNQASYAEQNRLKAENHRLIADKNRLEAEKNRIIAEQSRKRMAEIAKLAEKSRKQLNDDLHLAFDQNLRRQWGAEILPNNTIRFIASDFQFELGNSQLPIKFQNSLKIFFPKYINIIYQYRNEVEAIRIEGHTSSEWKTSLDITESYRQNMKLSQSRALETLMFCYSLINDRERQFVNQQDTKKLAWLREKLHASGLAFSHPIFKQKNCKQRCVEDAVKSKRVEFKIVTKAEQKLYKILELQKRGINDV
jgi:chemotaxis protein MotB